MKNNILFGIFLISLFSCKGPVLSDIQVIKFDANIIDTLKQTSDTSWTEVLGRKDFYTVDHYMDRRDSIVSKIFKDSLGNVVAFNKAKNEKVFFAAEYYANGQLIGKLKHMPAMSEDDSATYYYPDGRIKSIGQLHNYNKTGIWKEYNIKGVLEKKIYYDSSGNIIQTENN
jgi:hypothetical protein